MLIIETDCVHFFYSTDVCNFNESTRLYISFLFNFLVQCEPTSIWNGIKMKLERCILVANFLVDSIFNMLIAKIQKKIIAIRVISAQNDFIPN